MYVPQFEKDGAGHRSENNAEMISVPLSFAWERLTMQPNISFRAHFKQQRARRA